jgi:hypothetical protein
MGAVDESSTYIYGLKNLYPTKPPFIMVRQKPAPTIAAESMISCLSEVEGTAGFDSAGFDFAQPALRLR